MRDAATLFASLAAAVAGTICGALGAMFDRAAATLRPPADVIDLVDIEQRLAAHVPEECW